MQKLENILRLEKKKQIKEEFTQMTIEEFNALIDSAENDAMNNRLYNVGEIFKDRLMAIKVYWI